MGAPGGGEMITLPISYTPHLVRNIAMLAGATWEEVAPFYSSSDPIRQIERASIRAFMEKHRQHLGGRVLDFGAGTEPYRDLVGGDYVAHEAGGNMPGGYFDTVICNQVLQYLTDPLNILTWGMYASLRAGGHFLLTYATNWDEVEETDYWRFTKAGMERMLRATGFTVLAHELRAEVVIGHFKFPLGYGVLCTRG
jgi:SAM-dependent methyltransferase